MIGEIMSNMKFKVSSDANDAPPCVGSILSAHVIALHVRKATRPETEPAEIYQAFNLNTLPGGNWVLKMG